MKCGDAAAASIGAISSKADAIVVAAGIPIFLLFPVIFPHNRKWSHHLYGLGTIFAKEGVGLILVKLHLKHLQRLTNLNS
jgi:hypothetical protein